MKRTLLRTTLAAVLLASTALPVVAQSIPTVRVGWTIPAEEAKYWLMRRPQEFPNLGKTYKIEFIQFQGTTPMVQAMAAGALDCSTQAPLSLAQGAVAAAEAQKFETVARGRAAALQASPQPKPGALTPRLKRGSAAAGGRAHPPSLRLPSTPALTIAVRLGRR